MNLIQNIKHERAQRKSRQPFPRPLFNRISGIVREYGLTGQFLEELDNPLDIAPREYADSHRIEPKRHLEVPLFPMVTEEEYRIITTIIQKVDNPYLIFAQSPREILLSRFLFDRNPSIRPERLARNDFAGLLLIENTRAELRTLIRRMKTEAVAAHCRQKPADHGRCRLDALRERIRELRRWMLDVLDA